MSININVHGNTNILSDFERCRRDELKRRKLLRLAQVREQSKQMAATARRKFDEEQARQIGIIDSIKKAEINAWKAKHGLHSPLQPSAVHAGTATCIGAAHEAARRERAEELDPARQRQEEQRRQAAEQRGRQALAKVHGVRQQQQQAKVKRPAAAAALRVRYTKPVLTTSRKVQTKASAAAKHASTQVGDSIMHVPASVNTSCSAVEDVVRTNGQPSRAVQPIDISSDSLSSSVETRQPSQPLPRVIDTRPTTVDCPAIPPPVSHSPIRQASDLIRQRRNQQSQQSVNWYAPTEPIAVSSEPLRVPDTAWSLGLRTMPDQSAAKAAAADRLPPSALQPLAVEPLRQRNASPAKPTSAAVRKTSPTKPAVRRAAIVQQPRPHTKPRNAPSPKRSPVKSYAPAKRPQAKPKTPAAAKQPFVPMFNKPTSSVVDILPHQSDQPAIVSQNTLPTVTPTVQPPVAFTVSSSDEPLPARVQYYDHANRFSKEYVADADLVHVDGAETVEPNAMQAAVEEVERIAVRNAEMAEKRRATEMRGQRALQREQTRRDYELMSAQLDQFTKQPDFDRVFGHTGSNAAYTEDRLQQMAEQRDQQINRIFQRPAQPAAVAVVTCPRVDNHQSPPSSSSGINVADGTAFPVTQQSAAAPAETDSSALLLDYVNRRSADMETSVRHAGPELSGDKTAKLRSLLERINAQREQLLRELQQPPKATVPLDAAAETANALKRSQATIFQSVQAIEREKRKLLASGGPKKRPPATGKENVAADDQLSQERANIKQREHELSEKERRVEQKLRKLFAEEQRRELAKETLTNTKTQTDNTGTAHGTAKKSDRPPSTVNDGAPVQIIIQVNGGKKFDQHIRPHRQTTTPEKVAQATTKVKTTVPLLDKPKLVYPKTPVKNMPTAVNGYTDSSTSTTYNSLPKTIQTEFGKVLSATAIQPTTKPIEKPRNPPPLQQTILGQYITRLLGMSRASFDKLPLAEHSVSDSTTSSDVPPAQEADKLQRFISDNRSFISEVEESMHEHRLGTNDEENMKSIEVLWMRTLAKQESQMKRLRAEGKQLKQALRHKEREVQWVRRSDTLAPIKPILKKPIIVSPKKVLVVTGQQETAADGPAELPAALQRTAAATATDNCNARIAELAEKIEQIRREKQRLVENTFSSMGSTGSDRGQNSTEYIDVHSQKPSAEASQNSSRASNIVSFADDDKVPTGLHESAAAAGIGVSKDSGINVMSRPMTASDAHSPDPKSANRMAPVEYIREVDTAESTAHHQVQPSSRRHATRPPITAARFGPHIEELDIPHELSTIVEVDTPVGTSRTVTVTSAQLATALNNTVTTTAAGSATREQKMDELRRLLDLSAATEEKLRIRSFRATPPPPLEQTNATLADEPSSIVNSTVPQIQPFLTYSRYASEDGSAVLVNDTNVTGGTAQAGSAPIEATASNTDNCMQIRPFPSHETYAHGVSGLCTSASIQAAAAALSGSAIGSDDSSDSFPDVEAELMRRNLLQRPFPTYSSSSSDDDAELLRQAVQTNAAAAPSLAVARSTSSSDNLEAEMNRIGLNWASSMIRKSRQVQQQQQAPANATSTSTSTEADCSAPQPMAAARASATGASKAPTTAVTERPQQTPAAATTTTADNQSLNSTNRGQPLNLKDFLARELLKRSTSLSTSSTHDDSTMASLFLRSLLGSSASTNSDPMSSGHANGGHHASERHRTSTPVRMAAAVVDTASTLRRVHTDVSAAGTSQTQTPNGQLFSGESGMSSVREHSSSGSGSLAKK